MPATVREWLVDPGAPKWRTVSATVLSADISGFTRLAEQLSHSGARQSSEALTDAINRCFGPMIEIVHRRGGDVLKFGGDAVFVLFEGSDATRRAALAASEMQSIIGTIDVGVGQPLSMTVGIATGDVELILAGLARRELVAHGPIVDECLQLESDAERGEVLVCEATAAALPSDWVADDDEVVALAPELNRDDDQTDPVLIESGESQADGDSPALGSAALSSVALWSAALGDDIAGAIDAFAGVGGELRLVTVAFVLIPTGGQSPEAIANLVERSIELCERYGSTLIGVDVYRGGMKVLLAAGTPTAGGDDEDAMLSTVSQLVLDPEAPPMRSGVNRGVVYTGFLGSDRCQTFTVMGDPVNLAARLLGKAELGSVVVAESVLERARTSYETVTLAPVLVRGRTEPVTVHRLGGRAATDKATKTRPPFVGRRAESDGLEKFLQMTRKGKGTAVELVGEAGVGITRLMEEFIESLPAGVLHFALQAQLSDRGIPFATIRPLLRALASIDADASPREGGLALQTWVSRIAPEHADMLPLIAPAFGVEVDPTAAADLIAAQFRETRLHEVIVSLLTATLAVPTVIFVDNLHWADQASISFCESLALACIDRPWHLAVSRRAGSDPFVFADSVPVSVVPVGPLSVNETASLVAAISDLPDARQAEIVERSDGNPLFAVELVAGDSLDAEIPDSIEALMTARIDRLGHETRSVLRTAAVVGVEFRRRILSDAAGEDVADLLTELDDLLEAVPGGWVRFRSAILREVAYEGLSMRRRRELHGSVAEALEAHGAVLGAMAWHHDRAGNFDKSWEYNMRGAAEARSSGALQICADHLERAIEAADQSDAEIVSPREVTDTLIDLFETAILIGDDGRASLAAERAIERVTDPLERVRLLCRLLIQRGEADGSYAETIETLENELRELPDDDGRAGEAWVVATRAALEYRTGDVAAVLASTERAVDAARASNELGPLTHALLVRHAVLADTGGEGLEQTRAELIEAVEAAGDHGRFIAAHSNVGEEFRYHGDWVGAIEHYEIALERASATGDTANGIFAAINRATVQLDQGRWDLAGPVLDELRRVSRHDAGGYVSALARREFGRLEVHSGRVAEGRVWLNESLAWAEGAGVASAVLQVRLALLEADLAEGHSDQVLTAATEIEATDLPVTALGRVETLTGYAMLQQGRPEDALASFDAAVAATDGTSAYNHALALIGRSEAESFLGSGRTARRTRATADAVLEELGVVALPSVPLPR